MTKQRKNLSTDMHRDLVFLQEYMKKRVNVEELRLCPKCLQCPSHQSSYKVSYMKHNKVEM